MIHIRMKDGIAERHGPFLLLQQHDTPGADMMVVGCEAAQCRPQSWSAKHHGAEASQVGKTGLAAGEKAEVLAARGPDGFAKRTSRFSETDLSLRQ